MDLKRLVMLIAVGGAGGLLFIGVTFLMGHGDTLVTADLPSVVSPMSPTPILVSPKMSPKIIGDTMVSPTPEVTPKATQAPLPQKTVTPTPTITPTVTPKPTKTPTPTPEITPSPTPTAMPVAEPTPESTPTPEPEPESVHVVINEVAWMGTNASVNDEWIEIHNAGDSDIDLEGWLLAAADDSPHIALSGIIPAGGYFLLERSDDTTVSDVAADVIYTGALNNSCEVLGLYDVSGELVDSVGCFEDGWFAGDNGEKLTMERISPYASGLDKDNWESNNSGRNGLDANGAPINGTPRFENG